MFRRPRQASEEVVGRPPTPPETRAKAVSAAPPPTSTPSMPPKTKATPRRPAPLPTIGRQGPSSTAKKSTPTKARPAGNGKSSGNGSILAFFKKADEALDENVSLFVAERPTSGLPSRQLEDPAPLSCSREDADDADFDEAGRPTKRRRTSIEHPTRVQAEKPKSASPIEVPASDMPLKPVRNAGPFLEDSDSEQEDEASESLENAQQQQEDNGVAGGEKLHERASPRALPGEIQPEGLHPRLHEKNIPPLVKEETSVGPGLDNFKDFDDEMGDFDEDAFEDGDEFRERKYMEEQAELEAEDGEKDYDPLPKEEPTDDNIANADQPVCPICSVNLSGVSETDAGVHVNNCLDGNPTPLPERKPSPEKKAVSPSGGQFRRPVRAPRPGQASPFTLGQANINGGSAFNKLMSGHAEDAAWAVAAAAEHSSRGKPSYQRTCPFYKILPGLSICVDAFRYGAVQGCQAYFLSHFHSDHYIGLTASWSNGPIYCSKVTANLVRQQLRVDPKYVVPLEWEVPFEIPGTRGVTVTMISANHCPGSSVYLFEKVVGKKANGEPRSQRILHCGDFRACKMHVEHPLLRPDVQDKVSGKSREQKIDVCYLDTTYLTPKYAFPSQEAVITACADMCVCLSKDTPDESDGWEQMKRMRAGQGMVKFVRKESTSGVKDQPGDELADELRADAMSIEKNPHASQQILSFVNEKKTRGRLLVVVGTYSIGKERICLGIARALNSKIYAPPSKQRIIAALEDPELDELMTKDPREAQVHMTPLFEIRADTLDDYLKDYFPHFTRCVGFRPSGWNYRPPNSRFTESPAVQTVLYSDNWKSAYSMRDLVPQRGSSSRASCFGVPYSEHSSFRELTMFCCALRIDKIIPTVNVGSAKSRERMKMWCERWAVERKKALYQLPEDGTW